MKNIVKRGDYSFRVKVYCNGKAQSATFHNLKDAQHARERIKADPAWVMNAGEYINAKDFCVEIANHVVVSTLPSENDFVSAELIHQHSIEAEKTFVCGIYFLIGDKEIKYIGQSIDIVKRIREHRRCGRIKFDRFSMIPVCKTKLTEVETWYIRHFRPQYNKVKSKPTITELRIAMKRKKMESDIPLKNLDEILSEDNRALLDVIKAGQPTTIKSLAKMTGRKPAHLSRRLKYLENYGIIEIERSANHARPIIKITDY